MSIKFFLSLVFVFITQLGCFAKSSRIDVPANRVEGVYKKVLCVTAPKCGTHLLIKCLAFMGLPYKYDNNPPYQRWYERDKPKNLLPPPNHFKGFDHPYVDGPLPLRLLRSYKGKSTVYKWTHFAYTPEFDRFLDTQKIKKFLMIRDPRAMLVSFANMVKVGFEPGQEVDLELLILDLIDGRKKNYISWGVSRHCNYPTVWEIGICNFYRTYLPFIGSNNCLTVRFEDLVGRQGGGSDTKQFEMINKIAKHLNMSVNNDKILEIIHNLFGGSTTFNSGQIDGWKKYFTPEVKKAFKAVKGANKLLIDMGYEKNENW